MENKTSTQVARSAEGYGKRSLFRNLLIAMICFGGLAGSLFPILARIMLGASKALSFQFFLLCILAGFFLGWLSAIFVQRVVSNEISQIIRNLDKVIQWVQSSENQDNHQGILLPQTSSDSIGFLQNSINHLIDVLIRQNRALVATAQVSRRLSSISDPQLLFGVVVDEIVRYFHFDHARIFLYDDAYENLLIKGATGEAGEIMLSQAYSIQKGTGLIGRAAELNQVILTPDTSTDPGWLPSPLLPDTKSEVSIPIISSGKVLGVLNVQSNQINAITVNDVEQLQSIANQVGIAAQNAKLLTQAKERADREARMNALNQKIQSAMTIEDVIRIATMELSLAMGVKQALIKIAE